MSGTVTALRSANGGFIAGAENDARTEVFREVRTRRVLLATGADDMEPDLSTRSGGGSFATVRSTMATRHELSASR